MEVAASFDAITKAVDMSAKAAEAAKKSWGGINRVLTGSIKRLGGLDFSKATAQFDALSKMIGDTSDSLNNLAQTQKTIKALGSLTRTTTQYAKAQERVSRAKPIKPPPATSNVKEIATQYSVLEKVIRRADKAAATNEGWKELENRIDNAYETMIEFGASPEEAISNLRNVQRAAGLTGVSVATLTKIAEKFADEAETTTVTTRDLAMTLDFAALSGERAEDSARLMALASIGQTDALKRLDKQAQAAAKAIDDIVDPQVRAKLIAQQITLAQKRQNSVLGKARQRWAAFKISLDLTDPSVQSMWKGLKLLGVGALAVAGIIGGVLVKSIKTFTSQNVRTQRSLKKAARAWDDVKYTVGAVVLGYNDASKNINRTTGFLKKFNEFIKKNASTIQELVKFVARGIVFVAGGIAKVLLGFSGFVVGLLEGVQNAVQGIIEIINDTVFFARKIALEAQRFIADDDEKKEINQKLRQLRAEYEVTKKTLEKPIEFKLTEKVAGFIDLVSEAQDDADKFITGFGTGKGNSIKNLGPRKRPGSGPPLETELRKVLEEIKSLERLKREVTADVTARTSLNENEPLINAFFKRIQLQRDVAKLQEEDRIATRNLNTEVNTLVNTLVSAKDFLSNPEFFQGINAEASKLAQEARAVRTQFDGLADFLDQRRSTLFVDVQGELDKTREVAKERRNMLAQKATAEDFIADPEKLDAVNTEAARLGAQIRATRAQVEQLKTSDAERNTQAFKALQRRAAFEKEQLRLERLKRNPFASFLAGQTGALLQEQVKKTAERIKRLQPEIKKLLDIEAQIAQIQNPAQSGQFVGSTDPELDALRARVAERTRELNLIKSFRKINNQALTDGAGLAIDFASALGNASATGADVSNVLKQSLSGAIGQLVPMLSAYGAALVAAGTLNPFALFAATAVLSALTGAAQGALTGDSSPTTSATSVNRGDALSRDIEREREREETPINVTVFVGNEALDKRFIEQQQQNQNLGLLRNRQDRRG